jgi:histidine ammonia-lyase
MRKWLSAAFLVVLTASLGGTGRASETGPYAAIQPMPTGKTITLTGHDLTLEQIVRAARYGEAVEFSPEAVRHQEDAWRLLLEGAAEGVPIVGFNRGADGKVAFEGDPARPDNAAAIGQRLMAAFKSGTADPAEPEIADEDIVRATMVVRANTLIYTAASPPVSRLLVGMLNNRITPVAVEGGVLRAIGAAMVGEGDVYFAGKKMKARDALATAGLKTLEPMGMDDHALMDGREAGIAEMAVVAADARRALDWADLVIAMDLTAANANIAVLSTAAQANRPFRWMDWDALRLLDMLKGGAVFDDDPSRADTLPDELRGMLESQATAWMGWGALRDALAIALNSSDQSPSVRVDLSPRESFEMSTPEMAKFMVKGGRADGGKRGFIVDTINDSTEPLDLAIGVFTNSVSSLHQLLISRDDPKTEATIISEFVVGAFGERGGEDGFALTPAKITVDGMPRLLSLECLHAASAIDQRTQHDPDIKLGATIQAVMTAWRAARTGAGTPEDAALKFIRSNPVATFFPGGDPAPGTDDPVPLAQEKIRR